MTSATDRTPRKPSIRPSFAATTWDALGQPAESPPTPMFDPATVVDLPDAARRLLTSAIPAGTPLSSLVDLRMTGKIRLGGRWLPFTADQRLRAGVGFVWAPVVGGRVIRFVGADALGPDGARIEFRFHGRIPVVRGSGPDIHRSALGRLAAETVAWLPQALTPQAGARWVGIDDHRAVVTLDAAGSDVEVEVEVDATGQLRSIGLQRWNDSVDPPTEAPFGGTVDSSLTNAAGVRIAESGVVGWDWRTTDQAAGEFFRYRVAAATFTPSPSKEVSRP